MSFFSYTFLISEEYHIEEKTREIKDKDAVIAAKDKIINEKSDSIVSLESEIASLQVSDDSSNIKIIISCCI